jgi:hypothetical protein
MDLTITQDTGMDKKKPNNVSVESTVWPAECCQKAPLQVRECFGYPRPAGWLLKESAPCPLLRVGWISGKQVELWDSNVHKVAESLSRW